MREINLIVIHCSATPPSMMIGAEEIRKWHVNDRGWADIGYHYVIRRDGGVERGRPVHQLGAHVKGHNSGSIGICLVGGVTESGNIPQNNFRESQMESLEGLISFLLVTFPGCRVVGHRDLNPHKQCPCFSVRDWMLTLGHDSGEFNREIDAVD